MGYRAKGIEHGVVLYNAINKFLIPVSLDYKVLFYLNKIKNEKNPAI